MRRVRGFWIRLCTPIIDRINIKSDICDIYYKNESLLPSNIISISLFFISEILF